MNKTTVAMFLSAIGIIFFLTIPFEILAKNVGTFGGIAFFILSGFTWAFYPGQNPGGK